MNRVLVGLAQTGFLFGLALLFVGIGAPTAPAQRVVRACPSPLSAEHAPTGQCNRAPTREEELQWQRDHLAKVIDQQLRATPLTH